jgi:restriction endonuclease S subunit
MGMTHYTLSLDEISSIKSLRVNSAFYDKEELANSQIIRLRKKFRLVRLAELAQKVTQGLDVSLEESERRGEIGIVSIENIDDNSLVILPPKGFLPITPDRGVLKEGVLVTPRVRDIGNVGQVRKGEKYVSTENILNIELSSDKLSKYSLESDFVAIYMSVIGKNQLRLLRTGGQAGNINQWLVQETLIPLIPQELQSRIISDFKKNNEDIIKTRSSVLTLQEIIEETFLKFSIKTPTQPLSMTHFASSTSKIALEYQLRFGALYRWFWDEKNGKLFETVKTDFKPISLSSFVTEYPKRNEKQGVLSQDYYLIELDDIEALTSRVVTERLVNEINSDKVVFGDCDLLTTKLRPYLGYTILNDKSKPHLGSSELVPLKVKEGVSAEFIRYLLLTQDFLEKSLFLMYGKEHPRIQIGDILRMKVPNIPLTLQEAAVSEITEKEKANNIRQDTVQSLKDKAEKILLVELGLT